MSVSEIPSARLASNLVIVLVVLILLYFGQEVLVPIVFSCLFALLLIQPCNFFERQGFPRLSAALITVLLGLLVFVMVSYFISSQIISFKNDLPLIAQRLAMYISHLKEWVVSRFHVSSGNVQEFFDNTANQLVSNTSLFASSTFLTLSRVLFIMLIIPIYTFLILLYRHLISRFILESFSKEHDELVRDILFKTRAVVKGYIVGIVLETIAVAILLWLGFIIIGVKYAFLLATISALLKLIPYIGIVTACLFSMAVTLSTNSLPAVTGVLIVLLIVHIIDGNLLFPAIVGSKVKMNALATIVGVIVGNALWGIPGMFLAIPILATLKVVFDSVATFRPWAILIGDDPGIPKIKKRKLH